MTVPPDYLVYGPTEEEFKGRNVEQKRALVSQRVAAILGDETICNRCSATFKTMNTACTADLLDPCPGFQKVDAVQVPIEREVFGFR